METKAGLRNFAKGSMMDPRIIEIDPGFNSRDFSIAKNREHIDFLKASIVERKGIKTPLTVRLNEGRVMLVDGECRLRAVMELIAEGHPIERVPWQSEDRYINEADRLVDQVTRNSGKPFEPLELAHHCRRLEGFGWSHGDIAKKLSLSQSYISHLFGLLTMPEQVQQHIKAGDIAASTAATIIREEGEVNGVAAITEAVEERREEIAREEAEQAPAELTPVDFDNLGGEQPLEIPRRAKPKKEKKKRGVSVGKVRQKAAVAKGKPLGPKFSLMQVQKVSDFFSYIGRARSLEAVQAQAETVYRELFGKS